MVADYLILTYAPKRYRAIIFCSNENMINCCCLIHLAYSSDIVKHLHERRKAIKSRAKISVLVREHSSH